MKITVLTGIDRYTMPHGEELVAVGGRRGRELQPDPELLRKFVDTIPFQLPEFELLLMPFEMRYGGALALGVAAYDTNQIFLTAIDPLEYNDQEWIYRHWYAVLAHEIGHLVHEQFLPKPEITGAFQRTLPWRDFARVHDLKNNLEWKLPPEYFAEAWRLTFTTTGSYIPHKVEGAVLPESRGLRDWFYSLLPSEWQETDVAPEAKDGRTLVPLRFITELFGANVDYIERENKVTIEKDSKRIELWLGRKGTRTITW